MLALHSLGTLLELADATKKAPLSNHRQSSHSVLLWLLFTLN